MTDAGKCCVEQGCTHGYDIDMQAIPKLEAAEREAKRDRERLLGLLVASGQSELRALARQDTCRTPGCGHDEEDHEPTCIRATINASLDGLDYCPCGGYVPIMCPDRGRSAECVP